MHLITGLARILGCYVCIALNLEPLHNPVDRRGGLKGAGLHARAKLEAFCQHVQALGKPRARSAGKCSRKDEHFQTAVRFLHVPCVTELRETIKPKRWGQSSAIKARAPAIQQ